MKLVRLIPLCALLVFLTGCVKAPQVKFDPATEGVVDVWVLENSSVMSGRKEACEANYCVNAQENRMEIEPFEAAPMKTYNAAHNCFATVKDENGHFISELRRAEITDADGNPAEVTPIIREIFEAADGTAHDIFDFRIFEIEDEYFVFYELNVNLWTPCVLCYYARDQKKLVEIYEFDATDILGIRPRNLNLLNKRD